MTIYQKYLKTQTSFLYALENENIGNTPLLKSIFTEAVANNMPIYQKYLKTVSYMYIWSFFSFRFANAFHIPNNVWDFEGLVEIADSDT